MWNFSNQINQTINQSINLYINIVHPFICVFNRDAPANIENMKRKKNLCKEYWAIEKWSKFYQMKKIRKKGRKKIVERIGTKKIEKNRIQFKNIARIGRMGRKCTAHYCCFSFYYRDLFLLVVIFQWNNWLVIIVIIIIIFQSVQNETLQTRKKVEFCVCLSLSLYIWWMFDISCCCYDAHDDDCVCAFFFFPNSAKKNQMKL